MHEVFPAAYAEHSDPTNWQGSEGWGGLLANQGGLRTKEGDPALYDRVEADLGGSGFLSSWKTL